MLESIVLETERILLQPMRIEDADLIFKLYNSPHFLKYIGDRKITSVAGAENYIREKFLPQYARLGYGNFVVKLKFTGEKIGGVGIFEREGLEVQDIGFSFLPERTGLRLRISAEITGDRIY